MLLDAVSADRRIRGEFGATLSAAAASGDAVIDDVVRRFDLVLGADGVHSRVREGGRFGARVRGSGIRYVRTLSDAEVATGVEAWTRAGIFGAFPVDGGTYAFASCGTPVLSAALDARDFGTFQAEWLTVYPRARPVLDAMRSFDDFIINEVIRVDCDRWHDGRLVLVGDAAHAMAPNLGQGANSALVDVAVLVHELKRSASLVEGLAAYQRRRHAPVRRVATASANLGRMAEATAPVMRTVRDRLVLPLVRTFATSGATALLLQEPTATLRAIVS